MKLALCSTAAILFSASTAAGAAEPNAPDWVYGAGELPEKWSLVNESYAACDAGAMQSPVDLGQPNAGGEIDLSASYGETTGTLVTGPAKVQVDVEPGMGMISGDRLFSLLQMHFHTPAEHLLHGERYPLVVHLVHATPGGALGVLGVMFEEGESNPALAAIARSMESGTEAVDFDVAELVPGGLDIYRYMGSLTTPPCTEGVNWHVADEVLTASPGEIAAMRAALGTSNRSLQPLNSRLVVAPED